MKVSINPYRKSVVIDDEEIIYRIIPFPGIMDSLATVTCDYDEKTETVTDVRNIHRYVNYYIQKEYYIEHLPEYIKWFYDEKAAQKDYDDKTVGLWDKLQDALSLMWRLLDRVKIIHDKVEQLLKNRFFFGIKPGGGIESDEDGYIYVSFRPNGGTEPDHEAVEKFREQIKRELLEDLLVQPNTNFKITEDGRLDLIKDLSNLATIPIGSIIAWPTAVNPADWVKWLECNGQAINQSVYPELYRIVGANVPDYRGMFLRGYGTQNFAQNNGTTVGFTNTVHSSGALRTIQGDAIRNIYGYMGEILYGKNDGAIEITDGNMEFKRTYPSGGYISRRIRLNVPRIVPTANEIRPVNTAVRWLIRALI